MKVSADGKSKLVSRKGFSQWYPTKDLAEIYRITDSVAETYSVEQRKMKKIVKESSKAAVATSRVGTKFQASKISTKMQGESELSSTVPPFVEKKLGASSSKESVFSKKIKINSNKTIKQKPSKISAQATILQEFTIVK